MDGKQFDTAARGLARGASRRSVFGAAMAAAVAAATGSTAFALKGKRKRGRADDAIETPDLPGALTGGIWDETINICHFDFETGEVSVIAIPTPTVPDYLNQGDTLYIDCCVDTDCGPLPCFTPSHCAEGACFYDVTHGASCAVGDGTLGTCNGRGACVPTVTTPEVTEVAA
jgi:hypothetical protein